MLGGINEESVCLAVQKTAVFQREVFHVAKQLVREVKEPCSFTVVKVSAVGVSAFSEGWVR